MQSLKDTKKVAMVLILAVGLVAGTGLAAFILSRNVGLTMKITAFMDMILKDLDDTELTDAALGAFHRGETKGFPSLDGSTYYTMENTGESKIYVGPALSGFDPDVTVLVYVRKPGNTWVPLTDGEIWTNDIDAPGTPGNFIAQWYFTVNVGPSAAFGDYTPTLTWNAYDSNTG